MAWARNQRADQRGNPAEIREGSHVAVQFRLGLVFDDIRLAVGAGVDRDTVAKFLAQDLHRAPHDGFTTAIGIRGVADKKKTIGWWHGGEDCGERNGLESRVTVRDENSLDQLATGVVRRFRPERSRWFRLTTGITVIAG